MGSEFNADNVLVAASFGELDDLHFVASCYNIDNATAYSKPELGKKIVEITATRRPTVQRPPDVSNVNPISFFCKISGMWAKICYSAGNGKSGLNLLAPLDAFDKRQDQRRRQMLLSRENFRVLDAEE